MATKKYLKRLEIEIDCDGVLANMDGAYAPYVKDIIPDFSEEKYIREWNMPLVAQEYPEAYARIQKLWVDPVFISNLKRYSGVEDGLRNLYSSVKDKADIILHTHIFDTGAVYNSREKWLKDLRKETNVDFVIDISTGSNKGTRKTTDILVEDNVGNMQRSNADYKILIRRGHNRNYTEKDLGTCKQGFVCSSFYDSVDIIKKILRCD